MPTTSSTDLAPRLRLAITRTARRMRQEAGGGLSPSLAAMLATIDRHGPLSPSEIARRESVRRPTATRVVTRLESEGLVTRSDDPSDGRSCLISASARGRALLEETRTRKTAFLASRLEDLSDDDVAALARAAEVMERMLGEPRP